MHNNSRIGIVILQSKLVQSEAMITDVNAF